MVQLLAGSAIFKQKKSRKPEVFGIFSSAPPGARTLHTLINASEIIMQGEHISQALFASNHGLILTGDHRF